VNLGRTLFGAILIAIGTIYFLDAVGIGDAGEIISTWWPTVLIAAGALQFMSNPRHWLGPLIVAGVGTVILLNTTDVVTDETWPVVWAILLIVAGVAIASGALTRRGEGDAADRVNAFAAFSGREVVSHSDHFEGGTMGAVFGGTELDLRDAHLARDASLDVFAAFGGAEIRVPQGWRVVTHGIPLFGGIDNVTANEGDLAADAPTLDVSALVLFGGVDVKH
jgi:hypothetical protein